MNSLSDIWSNVIEILAQELTETAINTWFSDCVPVEIQNQKLIIHTSTDFKRQVISRRYSGAITDILSDLFSSEFELQILVENEIDTYKKEEDSDGLLPDMAGYTFDRFIVGSSNKFAHAAALAVSENPGKNYNPLFIYGNSGLGKTHLLLAIGQAIHTRDKHTKMAYIKGDDFMNQMVQSIRDRTSEDFRNKYRYVDLLLVDDIQFISGKISLQEEFFHTFNALFEAGSQIVITSDRPPIEMTNLEDRLRTRFEGGLMADVQPPDLETRMAITRNKASQLGMILPDNIVEYISESITSNVRQIEGVVKRLTAYREILDDAISISSVKRAIKDVIRVGMYIPTPEVIIEETARYYSLAGDDLRGQRRSKNTSIARHVSMYLMRSLTNLSLTDIGREYEGRNHSTVLSSISKIEDLLTSDPAMAGTLRDITSNINSKN